MSYTYLLGAEGESLEVCFSDIPPFARSSLTNTADGSCYSVSATEYCQGSQSGTTSEHSTDCRGADGLTSWLEDSHARGLVWRVAGPDWTTRKADFGANKPESLARFDPISCLLRTHQHSLFEAGCELLATLPRWGMIAGGELYRLPTPSGLLELRAWITSESASGFTGNLPTPTTEGFGRSEGQIVQMRKLVASGRITKAEAEAMIGGTLSPNRMATRVPTPIASQKGPSLWETQQTKTTGMNLQTWVAKRIPTPTQSMMTTADMEQAKFSGNDPRRPDCQTAKRLPTPTVCGNYNAKGASETSGDGLATVVKSMEPDIGGPLNPDWEEWLMGWPIGWTDLRPLETDKFRSWLRSHGGCLND